MANHIEPVILYDESESVLRHVRVESWLLDVWRTLRGRHDWRTFLCRAAGVLQGRTRVRGRQV